MKRHFYIGLLIAITLSACKSTHTAVISEQVKEISFSELDSYWIEEPTKMRRYKGRPDFIPPGRGQGSYAVTIDSNGDVVKKELIDSIPSGWLTQKHVDKMPAKKYVASDKNPEKQPVRVVLSFSVMPRSEIENGKA